MFYFTQFVPYFSFPAFSIIFSSLQVVKQLDLKGRGKVYHMWLLYISSQDFKLSATTRLKADRKCLSKNMFQKRNGKSKTNSFIIRFSISCQVKNLKLPYYCFVQKPSESVSKDTFLLLITVFGFKSYTSKKQIFSEGVWLIFTSVHMSVH